MTAPQPASQEVDAETQKAYPEEQHPLAQVERGIEVEDFTRSWAEDHIEDEAIDMEAVDRVDLGIELAEDAHQAREQRLYPERIAAWP